MTPRVVFVAMIAAFAGITPALAQSRVATSNIPVTGNAPNVCALGNPRLAGGGQVNFTGLNGNSLQVDTLVDPATLAVRGASARLQFEGFCNYPHRLRIEAQNNGLFRSAQVVTPAPAGFASAIPYSAQFEWGTDARTLNADAQIRRTNAVDILRNQATSGLVVLRVEIQPGASNIQSNAPVIAGNYVDTLRITLEPQQ